MKCFWLKNKSLMVQETIWNVQSKPPRVSPIYSRKSPGLHSWLNHKRHHTFHNTKKSHTLKSSGTEQQQTKTEGLNPSLIIIYCRYQFRKSKTQGFQPAKTLNRFDGKPESREGNSSIERTKLDFLQILPLYNFFFFFLWILFYSPTICLYNILVSFPIPYIGCQ